MVMLELLWFLINLKRENDDIFNIFSLILYQFVIKFYSVKTTRKDILMMLSPEWKLNANKPEAAPSDQRALCINQGLNE